MSGQPGVNRLFPQRESKPRFMILPGLRFEVDQFVAAIPKRSPLSAHRQALIGKDGIHFLDRIPE